MDSSDLSVRTAHELHELLVRREVRPSEIVSAVCRRIRADVPAGPLDYPEPNGRSAPVSKPWLPVLARTPEERRGADDLELSDLRLALSGGAGHLESTVLARLLSPRAGLPELEGYLLATPSAHGLSVMLSCMEGQDQRIPDELPSFLIQQYRALRSAKEVRENLAAFRAANRRKPVRAYIETLLEQAQEQAEEQDRALDRGAAPGRFWGIPLAVKDVLCTAQGRTTCASKVLTNFLSPYDATCVARLRAEGAIVIGKSNLDEFTFGSSTESSAWQPSTRNPWDTERVPGGSSGGSAAAVADGQAILALGSDTGGSIRQPASFCGVVGFKPSYGMISRWGLIAFASSLDCVGPLTRDVLDAAHLFECMAGPDGRDATLSGAKLGGGAAALSRRSGRLDGLRLGLPIEFYFEDPDYGDLPTMLQDVLTPRACDAERYRFRKYPGVAGCLQRAVGVLQELGATIEVVSLYHTRFAIPCYLVVSRAEAASNLARFGGTVFDREPAAAKVGFEEARALARMQGLGAQPKQRILQGYNVLRGANYEQIFLAAQRARAQIREDYTRVFTTHKLDALITPTTPTPAFRFGGFSDTVTMQRSDELTVGANLAGLPAISVPAGLDSTQALPLPVGLQFIGPMYRDWDLLGLAHDFERASGWNGNRPPSRR
ncbi:MAG: aspartyl/glutamyl-tRNA amidotransferase subunit A [Planctomycetes bacterium]|nr:aspartyl/glutamyl-tRNA amidotransferase subunit A [Planctomycetota bacterium]